MAIRLDQIEPEIVQAILQYVNESSPHSIRAVASVNKYFNDCVKVVQHHQKIVRVEASQGTVPLNLSWFSDQTILRHIRYLAVERSVVDTYATYESFEEFWRPFAEAIRSIGRLKVLLWNMGPIPVNVLKALQEHHPGAILKVDFWDRLYHDCDHLDQLEKALIESKNLTHFRAVFWVSDQEVYERSISAFKLIVANSANLCDARLNLQGYSPAQLNLSSSNMILNETDDLITPIDGKHKAQNVRHLTLDGPRILMSLQTLQNCGRFTDLGSLESIKFSRGLPTVDFFDGASSLLPSLKHMSLNLRQAVRNQDRVKEAACNYLVNCPPLQSLSLRSWVSIISIDQIIERHGATLKGLWLHEGEMDYPTFTSQGKISTRPVLTSAQLEKLRLCCPVLQDLTFDMNVSSDDFQMMNEPENLSRLSELAKIGSQLKRVQIYFDTKRVHGLLPPPGSDPENDPPTNAYPSLSDEAVTNSDDTVAPKQPTIEHATPSTDEIMERYAKTVWMCIYGDTCFGPRRLDVKFGEWESNIGVNVDVRRLFKIFPHERDDKPRQCFVKMHKMNQ